MPHNTLSEHLKEYIYAIYDENQIKITIDQSLITKDQSPITADQSPQITADQSPQINL